MKAISNWVIVKELSRSNDGPVLQPDTVKRPFVTSKVICTGPKVSDSIYDGDRVVYGVQMAGTGQVMGPAMPFEVDGEEFWAIQEDYIFAVVS